MGWRASGLRQLWPTGLVTPRHVESSWTRGPVREPMSPALQGEFLTIGPPGQPPGGLLKVLWRHFPHHQGSLWFAFLPSGQFFLPLLTALPSTSHPQVWLWSPPSVGTTLSSMGRVPLAGLCLAHRDLPSLCFSYSGHPSTVLSLSQGQEVRVQAPPHRPSGTSGSNTYFPRPQLQNHEGWPHVVLSQAFSSDLRPRGGEETGHWQLCEQTFYIILTDSYMGSLCCGIPVAWSSFTIS